MPWNRLASSPKAARSPACAHSTSDSSSALRVLELFEFLRFDLSKFDGGDHDSIPSRLRHVDDFLGGRAMGDLISGSVDFGTMANGDRSDVPGGGRPGTREARIVRVKARRRACGARSVGVSCFLKDQATLRPHLSNQQTPTVPGSTTTTPDIQRWWRWWRRSEIRHVAVVGASRRHALKT